MIDHPARPDWSKDAVVQRLAKSARPGQLVQVQVFVQDDIVAERLPDLAQKLVSEAHKAGGGSAPTPSIGRISPLSKSFALTADVATISAFAGQPEVKTILPAEIEDIYPKPRPSSRPASDW